MPNPPSGSLGEYSFSPIAILRSCFGEKFAVPRQSGLAPHAKATIELLPPFNSRAYVEGLQQCSHLWLQFVFHQHLQTQARAKVRPPRLGGNKKMGVFATRAPVRPNPIGLSVVRLLAIKERGSGVVLEVSGVDIVDGTPVLDIKPYVPYADAIPEAINGFAGEPPPRVPVVFAEPVNEHLAQMAEDYRKLLEEVLGQDPRPQYQQPDVSREYGAVIGGMNVRWRYQPIAEGSAEWLIEVIGIVPAEPSGTRG